MQTEEVTNIWFTQWYKNRCLCSIPSLVYL